MVDFNNETTITTSPKNILSILAIQNWINIIDAMEKYYNNTFLDIDTDLNYIQSRILTLYLQFKPSFIKFYRKEAKVLSIFDKLSLEKVTDFKDILIAFDYLNLYLYEKKITKLDDSITYDATNPFEENKARGFN